MGVADEGGIGSRGRSARGRGLIGSRFARNPARVIALVFLGAIVIGALVLMLPAASADGSAAPPLTALFTAVSAVCVTGLVVVDTPTYWSTFGQAAIVVMIQVGGFGILTGTSLAFLALTRRIGFRGRIMAGVERQESDEGQLRAVVVAAVVVTIAVEALAWLSIALRLAGDGYSASSAAWRGLFHGVSSFNNAGFALWSDNLVGFNGDAWMLLTISAATIIGGLGVPVWLDVRRNGLHWSRYALHSKLTLSGTLALLAVGLLLFMAFEWTNASTLGGLDAGERMVDGFFLAVQPRTAGFNSIDYGDARVETLVLTQALMLIGGGSASTAGGIKVGTFVLLMLVVISEVRGQSEVDAFGRSVPSQLLRRAFSVAFMALVAVSVGMFLIVSSGSFEPEESFFEAVSAFATVGLSTGITPELNVVGQLTCIVLMYAGRVGLVTVALALAFRERQRRYTYPEERPLIG
jgi:potassium uptake TrkH family protein